MLILEEKRKATKGKGHKILQSLLVVLAQVKAGNISENLSNEINQIAYSLYRVKKLLISYITNNEFNKVIKQNDTIFMNCEYSKPCEPYRLIEILVKVSAET